MKEDKTFLEKLQSNKFLKLILVFANGKKIFDFIVEYKIWISFIMIMSSTFLYFFNIIQLYWQQIIACMPIGLWSFLVLYDKRERKKETTTYLTMQVQSSCESFMISRDRIQMRKIYQSIYDILPKKEKGFMEIEKFIYPVVTQECYDLMYPKIKALQKKYQNSN